jgi:hypothetical protein
MKVELVLGIIEGDDKRFLESYVDSRVFRQRKSYDEYYVDVPYIEMDVDLGLLMLISEKFKVQVFPDCVTISERN